MPTTSNDHGRAFECIVVNQLLQDCENLEQTDNCIRCQTRDIEKINELDNNVKSDMFEGGVIISNWIKNLLSSQYVYKIDRFDDTAAMEGDVTDICIYNEQYDICHNFSIKHNHNATKHQRIPALMQALGFEKGSEEDILYRREYENIKNSILVDVNNNFPNATEYNEIKSQNPTYIDEKIYKKLCTFYMNSIKSYLDTSVIQSLFKFLVGNVGFYKCINYSKFVEIMDFTHIQLPTECNICLNSNSHIRIAFNNGFVLDMRLHSASSAFAGLSLKFDTQIINIPDDLDVIKLAK